MMKYDELGLALKRAVELHEGAATTSSKISRVIIVGGGIAGLAAAKRLIDSGIYDILILEATERVGGRLCPHPTEVSGPNQSSSFPPVPAVICNLSRQRPGDRMSCSGPNGTMGQ